MGNIYDIVAQYEVQASPLPHAAAGNAKFGAIMAVVFTIFGAVSLLMMTVGGIRYIVSQGDVQEAARAKNTIVYALVGLLISISAVAIVTFYLGWL